MRNLRTRVGIALLLVLAGGGTAQAYFNPPTISPANPVAGEPISMQIFGGECDIFEDGPNETDLVRVGSSITMTIDGAHADDPMLCFPDVGTWTYPVGGLPAGQYTLEVQFRYAYPGGPIVESLGTVSFSVTPPAATPVPSTTSGGGLLLTLLFLSGAAFAYSDARSR